MSAKINIKIYKSNKPWHLRSWRWRAQADGNNEILASGQAYKERGDAIAAVSLLFGDASDAVILDEGTEIALRRAL